MTSRNTDSKNSAHGMLSSRLFLYEHYLSIFFLVQIFLREVLSSNMIATCFIVLFFIKYKREGFKITFPLFVLTQVVLLYFTNVLLHFGAIGLLNYVSYLLPTYHCLKPTGPHKVGYKTLKIKESIDLAIFYPTQETTKDLLVHEDSTLTTRNYEGARLFFNIYIPYIVPKIIHEIAFSFFWKLYLGVNKDAKIYVDETNEKFPVIVFSHGIACTKNLYTIFTKEWASRGFIVFCVDHDEEIYCDWKYPEDLVEFKKPLLNVRKSIVKQTLDLIEDPEFREELFGKSIQVDTQKIFMAGHSFGGGTSATVATEDKRITGGVILLDPWMGPCKDEVFETNINLPILSIRTEEYDKIMPIRDIALRYVENKSDHIVSGYFKDSFHCTQCDLILYLPQELGLWDMNGKLDGIESQIKNHRELINIFIDVVMKEQDKKEVTMVMKEIRSKIKGFCASLDKNSGVFYFDK